MAPAKKIMRGRGPAPRPLGFDPFSGKPMEMKQIRHSGSYIMRNKRYLFGPFKRQGDLLYFFSTREGVEPSFEPKGASLANAIKAPPTGAVRAAATRPLTQCPFTGKKIQIVKEDPTDVLSRWKIQGEHYFIGGFLTERQAQHFFSTRDGIPPTFSSLDVEAVTREEPEDVHEGTDYKEAKRASEELADAGFGGAVDNR